MLVLEIALGIVLIIASLHYWLTKKKDEYETALLAKQADKSDQLKKTLAMGLYLRFKDEKNDQVEKYSNLFIRQNPFAFESFVAEVMEAYYGGDTWVTPPSNDYGVDIEQDRKEGLYLGQVKCYKNDMPFDAIAIIHSNMIKKNAVGGFVVSTAGFTDNARDYARELNIELIDGVRLVEYWLEGLEKTENLIADLNIS